MEVKCQKTTFFSRFIMNKLKNNSNIIKLLKDKLATFTILGTAIGTVISLVTSGLIASDPSLGWEGVFYIHGGLSIIWCIFWIICVSDTPQKHPFISDTEKEFIMSDQSRRGAGKNVSRENIEFN